MAEQAKLQLTQKTERGTRRVARPLSPATTAPAQHHHKAGAFIAFITSPHRKHLEEIVKCFPFEMEQWKVFPHKDGWLLIAVIRATAETIETFDFTGWFAQNGLVFKELIALAFNRTPSLARISQHWLGKKTNSRQILNAIREWLRKKVVKTFSVVIFVALLLNALQNTASPRVELVNTFARISPAWLAPSVLSPSAPPRAASCRAVAA